MAKALSLRMFSYLPWYMSFSAQFSSPLAVSATENGCGVEAVDGAVDGIKSTGFAIAAGEIAGW